MGLSRDSLRILARQTSGATREALEAIAGEGKGSGNPVYQHKRGEMTSTERRYEDQFLKPLLQVGMLKSYSYEGERIHLAARSFYTPDFVSIDRDGVKTYHECKGSGPVREASAVRFKWAVTLNPDCRFVWARERRAKDGGGFKVETIEPRTRRGEER